MPRRWPVVVLLFTGMVACYAHRGALSVAAPWMIKEKGVSPAMMGVLLSAFFWTYSFLQIPSGWLVDRLGVKRAYALGYSIWSVAASVTGFLSAARWSLIAARMGVGVGQSVAFPASARAVADRFPQNERATVTAIYLTGVRIGQALVGAVGPFLLAACGMNLFFFLTGVVPLIWLLPWMRAGFGERAGGTPALPGILAGVKLLRQRTALGVFLGFFAYDYTWFVFVNWLPGYLVLERHFTTAQMAFYSSFPYVAMSLVIVLAGILSDWFVRLGRSEILIRKIFISVGLLVACLIVPAGLVTSNTWAVWLLTASLCGLGIASANTWTLTQAVCAKPIVGTMTGIQNFGGNVGGILAPAVTGFIAQATGSFVWALSLTGVILLGGVAAYCFMISRRVEIPSATI